VTALSGSVLLRVIAVILFALATIIALGSGTFEHAEALIPGGLFAWCLSSLVP
jgi:hypothetical protein